MKTYEVKYIFAGSKKVHAEMIRGRNREHALELFGTCVGQQIREVRRA